MLNPIDTDKVIRDGGAHGRFPGEVHEAVGWWLGACLVTELKVHRIAVAHDGRASSVVFFQRLCRGAVNAQHYTCTVLSLRVADEDILRRAMDELGGVPGARVSSSGPDGAETISIILYGADGKHLDEDTGLAAIRRAIALDRVPIPVNAAAKGRVEHYPHPVEASPTEKGDLQ
ncbi:hypothetical protein [Streptomyces melanogenes]|uniref:hypothetical protein n=1 Tax=Streptomyces melanogenes TaxID=67326 RepID=UPI00167EBF59|nr:hypothetical protein [Streptomyces melanogenes]GGP84636.1 hypothetical protein GCM10010278_73910 [Streptomyces melanogenes]